MILPRKLTNALLLCVILMTALALRLYNLDSPSIGYHNMQENEYMGIAHEMGRTHDYLAKRVYYQGALGNNASVKPDPQPALVSYQALVAWKLLGENLWGPRLFNVIFGVLNVLIIYLISNILFSDRRLSLFAALLLAIMPLAVFFSRNLQPETPALFFMLLGSLFYLRFPANRKNYNLVLGGLSFSMAWLYKFSFLIGIFPFIFFLLYPTGENRKKVRAWAVISLALPYLILAAAILLLWRSGQFSLNCINGGRLLDIFSYSYWKEHGRTMWLYMEHENFTIIFTVTSLLGMAVALFRRRSLAERYIIGWTVALVPYLIIFSESAAQNNYCQMPFLALVCISTAYAASFISGLIKKFIKKDTLMIILVIVTVSSVPFVKDAITRMHSTVFAGVDVAGESLRDLTRPDEHIFLLTHAQGFGIARYADRYAEWTHDLNDFKNKEKKFGIRYICAYPAEFLRNLAKEDPALFDYIKNNYHFKEAGLTEEPKYLFYIILEKGRSSGDVNFMESISGQKYLKTIYRITGKYVFFYGVRQVSADGGGK